MRNRVQITIGTRRTTPIRRTPTSEVDHYAPELSLTIGCNDLLDGLNRAIRLLTSERDALMASKPIREVSAELEDDEEDEEPED